MSDDPVLVQRGPQVLRADPTRVVTRLFVPGQELSSTGIPRIDAVLGRVLSLTEQQVAATLEETYALFSARHRDVPGIFARHFDAVSYRVPPGAELSTKRRQLIGAYCTQELSVEAAAFLNPSMVAHPDQSGAAAGELRFLMSARAVGEGHVSSVEFRSGVVDADGQVRLDPTGPHLVPGRPAPMMLERSVLAGLLADRVDEVSSGDVLSRLPELFDLGELDAVLAAVTRQWLRRRVSVEPVGSIRWLAACNYRSEFPADTHPSERVMLPLGPDETHGLEDVRFTRFTDDGGRVAYIGTYTAFDGTNICTHLLRTDNFLGFESVRLHGQAAASKGMALFPRLIGGRYAALTRWDRENIGVATTSDPHHWTTTTTVKVPEHPWELIQLGNCGPPIETPDGWLVLTHGVGPIRTYGIGVMLLDLNDPTIVRAALPEPILTPDADEREGYVPNVLYSCGALVHGGHLVLPYGCSDSSIRFAVVDLEELLVRLRRAAAA